MTKNLKAWHVDMYARVFKKRRGVRIPTPVYVYVAAVQSLSTHEEATKFALTQNSSAVSQPLLVVRKAYQKAPRTLHIFNIDE